LAALVARRPGLRVPGGFEPFELAVRAILGQQVSVKGATTLAGRLASRFGDPIVTPHGSLALLFPRPERIASAKDDALVAIGLTSARARTLGALARAVVAGDVRFEPRADPDRVVADLMRVPGIGAWTAQYVAMRALGDPDAFPEGDLGLRRALAIDSARDVGVRAEAWRPWRAYAAMHLWMGETS
jgi:AraC family transcriptional regulator of adaptative response / DNA-3-methyladenine glycosylase II